MLFLKIAIAINILYLVIEDFRTKTVNIYFCISLFILSLIYAIYFNVTGYIDNLLSATLFLVCIYALSVRLQKDLDVTSISENNIDNGLAYLPIVFLGFLVYKVLNLKEFFIDFLKSVQISIDFLSVPICIFMCFIIFIQVLRCHFHKDKKITVGMGDGDIWAIMGVAGLLPISEFFIIIFLANIIFILIYAVRRFLCN